MMKTLLATTRDLWRAHPFCFGWAVGLAYLALSLLEQERYAIAVEHDDRSGQRFKQQR